MKKNKIFLGCSAAVASIGAVSPLVSLASCGNNTEETFEIKYDEEYGVDEFTYNTVEKQFKQICYSNIEKESISDEQKQKEKVRLNADISTFRNQISQIKANRTTSKSAYTIVSNALIDHAQDKYGIRLNRNSKAQWSDIEKMYSGLRNSWKAYLQASGIIGSKLETIMSDVEMNYQSMNTSLKSTYADPLSALIKAKNQLPVVFSAINSEIAYLAASSILKDFLSSYTVTYNENGTNNKLDQLEKSEQIYDEELGQIVEFKENSDITAYMNKIFTVRNAKTGAIVSEGFSRHIIPGWRISPILTSINHDDYKNSHSISISWQCVKDTYEIGSEDAKKATAYSTNIDENKLSAYLASGENLNTFDAIEKSKTKPISVEYAIPLTAAEEAKRLKNTFLSNDKSNDDNSTDATGHIRIFWDKSSDKNYIDGLTTGKEMFPNNGKEGHRYFEVNSHNFAKSGAKVEIDIGKQYDLMDLFENAANIVDEGKETETTRYNKLPGVIKGLGIGCQITAIADVYTEGGVTKVSFENTKLSYNDSDNDGVEIDPIDTLGINWTTSQETWRNIIDKYNVIKIFFNDYEENIFEKDYAAMKKEKIMNDVMLSLTIVFDSLIILSALLPSTTPGSKIVKNIYVVTSFIDMGLEISSYLIFSIHKKKVVTEYADKAKGIKETAEFKDLKNQLDNDKNAYHLIDAKHSDSNKDSDDELYIDEELFQQYYKDYYEKDAIGQVIMSDHYIHSNTDPVLRDFNLMLRTRGLDAETYKQKMSGWEKGGKWDVATKALMISSLALFGLEMIFGLFDGSVSAACNAKWPAKAAAHAAEQSSKNFFRRIWSAFTKLFKSNSKAAKNADRAANLAEEGSSLIKPGEELLNPAEEGRKILSKALEEIPDADKVRDVVKYNGEISQESERFMDVTTELSREPLLEGAYTAAAQYVKDLSRLPVKMVKGGSKVSAIGTVIKDVFTRLAKKTGAVFIYVKDEMGRVTNVVAQAIKDTSLATISTFRGAITATDNLDDVIKVFIKVVDDGVKNAKRMAFNQLQGVVEGSKEYWNILQEIDVATELPEILCQEVRSTFKAIANGLEAIETAGEVGAKTLVRFVSRLA